MKIDFITSSTGGQLISGNSDLSIKAIETDSRNISAGSLFVALKGSSFNGHDFVPDAFKKGAAAAMVSDDMEIELNKISSKALIKVNDTLEALQKLAKAYRQLFNIPVVAVTGSVGKTTTKDIISQCLGSKYQVLKTEGNYNNEIGLPLTILRLDDHYGAAVVEMAMRAPGEIAVLAKIAQPTCVVITNVEPVHLETLKTITNIARAKCEVLQELNYDDFALVNGDNQQLLSIAREYRCKLYTFGYNKSCDFKIINTKVENTGMQITVDLDGVIDTFYFPVPSSRLAGNVVSALGLAKLMDFDLKQIKDYLCQYNPSGNRLNIKRFPEGGVLINDTYNANPVSMAAALETAQVLHNQGNLVAVLGDMFELGPYEVDGHLEVGKKAAAVKIDKLIILGERARYIAEGAINAGLDINKVYVCNSKPEALEYLCKNVFPEDTILFKASRGMRLETLVEEFSNSLLAGG